MTVTEHLRTRLLSRVNAPDRVPDYNVLVDRALDKCFLRLCTNRMVMGEFRYGFYKDPNQPKYDRIASIEKRLAAYKKDRNAEHLVDIANIAMIEFVRGDHGGLIPVDDSAHHVERKG